MSYFIDGLNYTLSNEDTQVEQGLLEMNRKSVFCIGGSGARALPLIAQNPEELSVVDLSELQLKLVELRLVAAKQLSHEEYLFFIGYRGGMPGGSFTGESRYEIFKTLNLSAETKKFWESQKKAWTSKGFIYLGRWERHFLKLSKIFRSIFRFPLEPIFEAQSLEEQKIAYEKHFHPLIFRNFLRVVASEFVFDRFLYKGHFSGSKGKKSDHRTPWQMVDEEFKRLFHTQLVRKNYFFQMLFLGQLRYEEGYPVECHRKTIEAIKKSETKVSFHTGNLLLQLKLKNWDFISLSDTISYLSDAEMTELFETLENKCDPGCRVVIRSFLRSPPNVDLPNWDRLSQEETRARDMDGTGVYQFHIMQKKP
jgi:S-adenosylmethionine-diacylglycerol 3-amino-3-carboxypropyl transferase